MKYLAYPEGFDPVIAAGPPTDFYRSVGCEWTEKDTARMKELEKGAVILDHKPDKCWFREISDSVQIVCK